MAGFKATVDTLLTGVRTPPRGRGSLVRAWGLLLPEGCLCRATQGSEPTHHQTCLRASVGTASPQRPSLDSPHILRPPASSGVLPAGRGPCVCAPLGAHMGRALNYTLAKPSLHVRAHFSGHTSLRIYNKIGGFWSIKKRETMRYDSCFSLNSKTIFA